MPNIPYEIAIQFGSQPVRTTNEDTELVYRCPMCTKRGLTPDYKGHLYVNIHNFTFNCFRCGYKGCLKHNDNYDNKDYVDEYEPEPSQEELLKSMMEIVDEDNTEIDKLKIPINKVFESKNACEYLYKRGFTDEQLNYYDMRIGNLNFEFGRIIIPNQVDHRVYTDFYSARSFIGQEPRYHNPKTKKSNIVFNLWRIEEHDTIIITEGVLTAIAAGKHAVAILGKVLSKNQAIEISLKKPNKLYLNLDYKTEDETKNACQIIKSVMPETPLYVVKMKDDRDAADLTKEEYIRCLESAELYNPLYDDLSFLT